MTVLCNQTDCDEIAIYRFTWPGKDEAGICALHARKLRGVAAAIGLHVEMIPLTVGDHAKGTAAP